MGGCVYWYVDDFYGALWKVRLEFEVVANVLGIGNELREVPDFHTEIENKMKMNW